MGEKNDCNTRKNIKDKTKEIYNNNLPAIVGTTSIIQNTKIQVDTDVNGTLDKEWTVKTDGSKIEKDISPIVVAP